MNPSVPPAAPAELQPDHDIPSARVIARNAGLLFLGLLVVYHANGASQGSNDTAFNTFLPTFVLERQSVTVTPSEMPSFFDWELQTPAGRRPIPIVRWDDASRKARDDGGLILVGPRYFLVASPQVDPQTGETRYVNTFGAGAGLSALPVFAAFEASGTLKRKPEQVWIAAKLAAALLVALSAVCVYLTCLRYTRPDLAVLLAATYGLGTCVWSISSQALWQHGPSEFCLALGTLCLTRSRGHWAWAAGCGLAFALAVTCRPTNALVVVAVGGYFVLANRRRVLPFVLAGLPVALALGAYHHQFHGSVLSFGRGNVDAWFAEKKTGSPDVWQTPLGEGLAGLLVSPSRGLLVHSPVLIFGLVGLVAVWRRPDCRELCPIAVSAVALVLLAAKWYDWWGGWCFGYRPIVDVAPLLVVLIAPILDAVWRLAAGIVVFVLLLAASIAVQALGAFAYHPPAWNARAIAYDVVPTSGTGERARVPTAAEAEKLKAATPGREVVPVWADIDMPEYRNRLWSVKDSQVVFMAKNFAVLRQLQAASNKEWPTMWK